MAAPRPPKSIPLQLQLPTPDLPTPEHLVPPETAGSPCSLPPCARQQSAISPRPAPSQVPPAFPFPAASGIPPGVYSQLLSRPIRRLQPRDVLGVRGSVPRGGYGWGAGGGRMGGLHCGWGGEEEPWPDVVPFRGLGEGRGEGGWSGGVALREVVEGEKEEEVCPDAVPLQDPAEGSLAGWITMHGNRMGEIIEPVHPMSPVLPDVFDPIFFPPSPQYRHATAFEVGDELGMVDLGPPTFPSVFPRPRRFYRVQHSAAFDEHGTETFPPSRTRDSAELGLTASTIFPPCFERRVNRSNLERALDPMNVEPTSLVALYSNYGSAVYDFEIHRQMGCEDVYIAHIAADTFTRGTIPVWITPPGMGRIREMELPVVGLGLAELEEEPRVVLFSVLSCLEFLGIETEMRVAGVWFAIDSVPAQFIVHRERRGVPLDVNEGEEERDRSRSPSSFVDDETPDNRRSASIPVEEIPAARSPDVAGAAQGNEGEEGTWMSELNDLVDDELEVVARDVSDAATSPDRGNPSPRGGSFIYDNCDAMW